MDISNLTCAEAPAEMKSTWQSRLQDEFSAVSKRIDSLDYMLYCWDNDELYYVPKTPKNLLEAQLEYMKKYKMCLEARLKIEGII